MKSITGKKAQHKINMFKVITISDEAFTRWVLEIKLQKVMAEIKENNLEPKKEQHSKRTT